MWILLGVSLQQANELERCSLRLRGTKMQMSVPGSQKWGRAHRGKHWHEPQTEIVGRFGDQGDKGAFEG